MVPTFRPLKLSVAQLAVFVEVSPRALRRAKSGVSWSRIRM